MYEMDSPAASSSLKLSHAHVSKMACETEGSTQKESRMAKATPRCRASDTARRIGASSGSAADDSSARDGSVDDVWGFEPFFPRPSSSATPTSSSSSCTAAIAMSGHSAPTSSRRIAEPMHAGGTAALGTLKATQLKARGQLENSDASWTP